MKLALLGDIALFGNLSYKNNPVLDAYFSAVADYLATMDYVVGNLETPFSVKRNPMVPNRHTFAAMRKTSRC